MAFPHRVLVLSVALIAVSGCVASTSSPKASLTPTPSAEIDVGQGTECLRGLVTDDELVPLSNALVGLVQANATVTTGADGAFEFCGLLPGRYVLVVSRLGYESANRAVQVPQSEEKLHITLKPIPVAEPYFLTFPKIIYYVFGLSTLDTTTSRQVGNLSTCGPCTWSIYAPSLPDFLVWEAAWKRNPPPPSGVTDLMYYLLRGGAPFEKATDIGSANPSLPQPWRVEYPAEKLLTNANVKAAAAKGEVPLSGSMFCWGSQPYPCVDQRIEMWVTLLYDYTEEEMGNFTARPPTS